jgi:Zn-dependent metalloprotease
MIFVFDLDDPSNSICPNAFWDGEKISACTGLATEDIIGHEWGHAYDEHTANLVYQDQSGALNEALADIVGETLQQLFGNPSPVRPIRSCNNGNRWIIGEDVAQFPGGLRDMYNPNCRGQPSNTQDVQFAYCGSQDNGGVHTNSGVANQFYSLLVDGGSLNSQTVQGIGFFKGFHIVMRAMMVHLTPSSDFPAFGTAVLNSCNELQGINLNSPVDGTLSGQIINAADCQSVGMICFEKVL